MNLTARLRPIFAALLLAASATSATVAAPAPTARLTFTADTPAAHPNFTVRVVGKGWPVLLIPGLTCPGAVWDETVAHYQKQYQCHIISLTGFGGVPAQASTDNMLLNVRDQLLAYIKTQKLTKPVVIGHSLGGFMALWMSSTQPEVVGPLVIVDSLPFIGAIQNPAATVEQVRPMAENMRRQVAAGQPNAAQQRQMAVTMVTDTARISQVTRWGVQSAPAAVAQAMYDMYTTDLRADLARIQQPVLVLGSWAAYQSMGATKESTKAIFTRQYAQLPRHQVEMSEAGRHFLMYDDTQWFFQLSDAFLKQNAVAGK
ncbi:alpha/beta fold hydrolase [Hymenobacter perfusus]|uniref:Alpha/beta hydrolase n=1 Tax=Hymenobacter perfusus TaxID=1236770 RepID=A0A3R9N9N5_9BACT|nr:alpha/beta hydrolase [Hymenobacter perfusus]RSK42187.1 alpha/beta hydrolase [Hymenobacter perfusus]